MATRIFVVNATEDVTELLGVYTDAQKANDAVGEAAHQANTTAQLDEDASYDGYWVYTTGGMEITIQRTVLL